MVKGTFWNLKKKSPHYEEEDYEIVKIFGGFGKLFNF